MGQSQGITYQAILIDENDKEIPGVDVQGNYLPNQELTIRFTISDENGSIDYQEEHTTQTDDYGMINVTIGIGTPTLDSPGIFADIDWDGTPKSLSVEIRINSISNEFAEFSSEELKFVPYAYHRNITATGTMIIDGTTDLNSDLTVNNESPTYLTGSLTVDDRTDLNSDLSVHNNAVTNLSGTLTVEEETNINSELYVNNGSATNLSGELNVQGETTLQNVNLTTLNSVSDQESFTATFENTNSSDGDGIKIKLGKRATKNNSAAQTADAAIQLWLGEVSVTEFQFLTGILDGNLSSADLTSLTNLAIPTTEDATAIAATVCEMTEMIGTELVHFLNSTLSLPLTLGPYGVTIAGVGYDIVPEITMFPALPDVNLPCSFFGSGFELPNVKMSDIYVTNPLNSENLFVEFTDNDDFSMGAIKAQSIENWAMQYLDIVFLYELYATFKGIDKAKIIPAVNAIGKDVAKSYLGIGVSYSSGNGDYAEWLERLNPDEIIETGHIVGVQGGKITKDLTDAEQVMAVSSHPIVLGNTPKAGKEHLGNNVAFMGQIPVKIMGPVRTGDYIVGKGDIPGYGVAVRPENMNLEDFKYAVGRSWAKDLSTGPKMVNTVVGVHNGDYLNVIKKYNERLENTETRLKIMEDKLDLFIKSNSVNKN